MGFDVRKAQEENKEWADRNFGMVEWEQPFMGMVEELGELSHALLKQRQGIRGTWEEHEGAAKDACGDLYIYLMDLCNRRYWSLEDILKTTWNKVKKRNWISNPITGEEVK